jgi:predicted phosphodiesterase
MKRGEFTVIDATNTKTVEMNRYKNLAKKYRYRIYCIDMTDVPIEVAKAQNKQRDPLKFVPEEAIDRAYARFANQQIPSGIKVLKPDEADQILYHPTDLSQYDKIHVIGDIHGCYTALNEYLPAKLPENEYFIFLGDYLDRGIENAETLTRLMKLSEHYKNVTFLEGNHEAHLRAWANDEDIASREFRYHTLPQLEDAGINKKEARMFCRRLNQCIFFKYDDRMILVTHGGLSTMPKNNLVYVATEQMIKGVGGYADAYDVDWAFHETTLDNYIQVHGHRNETNMPIQVNSSAFNLNGNVEFGGYLRAITFGHGEQYFVHEVKNNVFRIPEDVTKTDDEISTGDMADVINYMRASKYINEKKFDNISSFNFTREAFNNGVWDGITTKARGLYLDTQNNEVVARGYEKFFNYNEKSITSPEMLSRNLVFPVSVYVKENGYLGIMSTDHDGNPIFATKSSLDGDHAKWFEQNMKDIYGTDIIEKMRRFAYDNHVSFVFEVIDIKNDPHIIKYKKNECILLDIIKNDMKFEKYPYIEMCEVAADLGLEHKYLDTIIPDYNGLTRFIAKATADNFVMTTDRIDDKCIEGFVFEDANGFMFKLKVPYYNEWKMLRGVARQVLKTGNIRYTGALQSVMSNYFYGWCKEKFNTLEKKERREYADKDIITLRDEFLLDTMRKV